MNKQYLATTCSILIFSLTACGGGGGGTSGGVPAVPANAVVIDNTNALDITTSIASTMSTLAAFKAESDNSMNQPLLQGLFPRLKDFLGNRQSGGAAVVSLASGVLVTDSGSCSNTGGTFTSSFDVIDTPPTYSEIGFEQYVNCVEGGLTLDGRVDSSYFENSSTGDYSQSIDGSFSFSIAGSGTSITVEFTELDFQESGNFLSNTYVLSAFNFAINLTSPSLTQAIAVAVTLDAAIVESNGDFCPDSGTFRILGGSGSFATGTFNGTNIAVSANGNPLGSVPCI